MLIKIYHITLTNNNKIIMQQSREKPIVLQWINHQFLSDTYDTTDTSKNKINDNESNDGVETMSDMSDMSDKESENKGYNASMSHSGT
jgi:hypothetical protein